MYTLPFLSLETFTPPTYTSPRDGFSCLYKSFMSVLFPLPDAPIMNTNSPFDISRLTSHKAVTPLGYLLYIFLVLLTAYILL